MQIKTTGLVLKQRNIGENDRIITILSKEYGVIEASAKNVKTIKSSISSGVQILTYTDFCLYKGKSQYIINCADSIDSFYDLRLDVVKLSLGAYFCELTAYLCNAGDDNAKEYLRLILNTLHFLQKENSICDLNKSIFELRSLEIAGFMPNLVSCNECGIYECENMLFFPIEGILLCGKCNEKSNLVSSVKHPLKCDTLSSMRYIIFSDLKKLFKFNLTGISLKQLSFITGEYTKLHTDTKFKSLEIYKSLTAIMQ